MIKLQDFISDTLKQIIDGVADAQEYAKIKNSYINVNTTEYSGHEIKIKKNSAPEPQLIEFDIALTTTEDQNIKGGLGIFVTGIGLGYQGETKTMGSEISRIKFSIPVILPSDVKPEDLFDKERDPQVF